MVECNNMESCTDRRMADAEQRGKILAKLDSIEVNLKSVWGELQVNRSDFKDIYFKIGIISGGTSFVVSLTISLVGNLLKGH